MQIHATHNNTRVIIAVVDLDAFIHALPDDDVFVTEQKPNGDTSQYEAKKRELTDFKFEE